MKILAAAGSSGGHIFPALAFLDCVKSAYPDSGTLLVVPSTKLDRNIFSKGHPVRNTGVRAISRKVSLSNIRACAAFFKSFFQSAAILAEFKPDAVVGFGSIASVPVVICAWLMRIPVLIHEQNVIPGKANRLLIHICQKCAISFEQTAQFLGENGSKLVLTGNPVRRDLTVIDKAHAVEYFKLKPGIKTLLVMGGSQSSRKINFGFAQAFKKLGLQDSLQVIHLCGTIDKKELESEYGRDIAGVRLVEFMNDMQYAYSASDLAVCRAGATTIAELVKYRLPAVLIPYPYAQAHQTANAQVLEEAGCARIIQDSGLEEGTLLTALDGLLRTPRALENMRSGFERFCSIKTASLAEEVKKLCSYE
ncbi:MAG: UDP-N-acetylglucosamine--N-acetylmuramyl-(pentapeptide) pyrophosphoryl-undecaprenol N-acetylglucosamine transferase [Candidatus Omnitrophica bacterium]|nr:UDP-N-acetylglucosamine--N-acetylmuramyl-(pentapeptide) pyrophosphoryl-undecaprenol N-acetylglucosamine transferase [Candidatus Omnitrophota bacterium]